MLSTTRPIYLIVLGAAAVLFVVVLVVSGTRKDPADVDLGHQSTAAESFESNSLRSQGSQRPKIDVYYET